jgi:hypothetical protein
MTFPGENLSDVEAEPQNRGLSGAMLGAPARGLTLEPYTNAGFVQRQQASAAPARPGGKQKTSAFTRMQKCQGRTARDLLAGRAGPPVDNSPCLAAILAVGQLLSASEVVRERDGIARRDHQRFDTFRI